MKHNATCIHIHGLCDDSSEDIFRDHYRVMATKFWAFHNRQTHICRRVVSLVRLIRLSTQYPDAVVLDINNLQLIKRLPENRQIAAQWKVLCKQLRLFMSKMKDENCDAQSREPIR